MLDYSQHSAGAVTTTADLLALGHLFHACPSGNCQGTAWNHRGVARKSVAFHDRRGRMASVWWFARRGNRPASGQFGCEILSAIYGGDLHTGYDGARASAFGPRGLVHVSGRNMPGDSGGQDGRASGRLSRHCAWRSANASHGYRHRDPPRAGPYSPRFDAAPHDPGARLDAKRVVPRLTCNLTARSRADRLRRRLNANIRSHDVHTTNACAGIGTAFLLVVLSACGGKTPQTQEVIRIAADFNSPSTDWGSGSSDYSV